MIGSERHCLSVPYGSSEELDSETFQAIRRQLVLEHCKWDPQVGDVSTLAPFALLVPAETWRQLSRWAERLAAEALQAEQEIVHRLDLLSELGLPRRIHRTLAGAAMGKRALSARVIRFDFHWTSDGCEVSEANSDVPGGYTEASAFPRLMAEHFPGWSPAGDPAGRLVDALIESMGGTGHGALLSATGYMEDQQVTAYLASRLQARGCAASLAHPRQIVWRDGKAWLGSKSLDAVVRFYQGEWMSRFARLETGYFGAGKTPVCNPGPSLIIESKRFPLVWRRMATSLPTWEKLLPASYDPRQVSWHRDPAWILKKAYSNTGDTVIIRPVASGRRWQWAAWRATLRPDQWVVQRRFEALPLSTPAGMRYPCLGVYVVNGRTAGVYGRIASRPLIDYAAQDIAVLVKHGQGSSL
jgi:glutathionylspermidine synthase